MIPAALTALVRDHDVTADDFASLRLCRAGADKVSLELEHEFQALSGLLIDEGYGMTEVGLATLNPPRGPIKQGSIGRPVGGFAICVRDDERCECRNDTVGRVWIRTRSQTIGYWDNPEATAEILRDGWLDSGDLARADDDGYLWFFGRKKQIIVHDGSNISPGEVEEALAEHPAVALVGVVGIHDEVHGENVRAYVTVQDGAERPTSHELIEFAARTDRLQGAGRGGVPRRDAGEPHRQARPRRAEGDGRGPPAPARAAGLTSLSRCDLPRCGTRPRWPTARRVRRPGRRAAGRCRGRR